MAGQSRGYGHDWICRDDWTTGHGQQLLNSLSSLSSKTCQRPTANCQLHCTACRLSLRQPAICVSNYPPLPLPLSLPLPLLSLPSVTVSTTRKCELSCLSPFWIGVWLLSVLSLSVSMCLSLVKTAEMTRDKVDTSQLCWVVPIRGSSQLPMVLGLSRFLHTLWYR